MSGTSVTSVQNYRYVDEDKGNSPKYLTQRNAFAEVEVPIVIDFAACA